MVMTPEEARARVERIKDVTFDDESAHSMEDELYANVVRTLASIQDNPDFTFFDLAELVQVAQIALETENISFARWCA
jgi:hypothetical protein